MTSSLTIRLVNESGRPVEGVFVRVTALMKIKNHHSCFSHCSDATGRILLMASTVACSYLRDCEYFLMDYVGLYDDTFEQMRVDIPRVEHVDAAIRAYEQNRSFYDYHTRQFEDLTRCRDALAIHSHVRFADPPFHLTDDAVTSFGEEVVFCYEIARKINASERNRRTSGFDRESRP